jgi:H-type small acid-soluble spore protein
VEVERAKEILMDPGKIQVHYNGESVWIDSIDTEDRTAAVHPEEKTGQEPKVVPVAQLQEMK